MDVTFADGELARLYSCKTFTAGHSDAVVKAYRDVVLFIAAAKNEQDLRRWQSLHFAASSAGRDHRWSVHLHGEWRLILEKRDGRGECAVLVVGIEESASVFPQVVR